MKKGNEYEGTVQQVDFPNKGIVVIEGRKIIVKNVIAGQKVRFAISKMRRNNIEGKLLEIMRKSSLETKEPVCPQFEICGGCKYQTMSYLEQLRMKEGQVRRMLRQACEYSYIWEGIKASPQTLAYRNKMEFSFGDEVQGGPLTLGLHKRNSFYDVITTADCKIVDEDFTEILKCVLSHFKENRTTFYHKMRHIGYLRHLLIRKGIKTGEILVSLVTTSQESMNLDELKQEILHLECLKGNIVGILHVTNDSLSDVVQADKVDILYGQDFFYEELLGLRFKISTFSFFQTNSLGAEILYQTVQEYVGDLYNDSIIDLYCGTGTITQILSPVSKKVLGIEIVEEAVEAARLNAKRNQLDNCEFIAGDVLKVLDTIHEVPNVIVLDPPRDGIHPKALRKIVELNVDKIIYISCKPTSLVRDLEVLHEAGYTIRKGCCLDMFPNTVHVESVIMLQKDA